MCFCFGSGFPTDCDPHPGDSSRAAGPGDPRSDSDSAGGPAEAHAAAGRDHGGGPAADPRCSQPSPGAGQLRQPEPAAQAPDESPRRQVKDAHQASVPLVGSAARPQAGRPCLPPPLPDGVDLFAEPQDSALQGVRRLERRPSASAPPSRVMWLTEKAAVAVFPRCFTF